MLRFGRILPTILVLVLVVLDLASKNWAQTADMTTQGPTPILPFASLVLAYNPGLTFGGLLGLSQHPFFSTLLSIGIIAGLAFWFLREKRVSRCFLIAFPLAGSFGNAIDRLINSMVTDFLQIHLGGDTFLVVNLADLWIVTGILGLTLSSILSPRSSAF